jgi:hypothetical protein
MDPVTAAVILGTGVQIFGGIQSRKAAKRAEEANARYLAEQKRLSMLANKREADIFGSESDKLLGSQTSMLSKAGVDFSGSAIMGLVESKGMQMREKAAIIMNGGAQARLADMRMKQANDQARYYGSSQLAATQTLGTLLNAAVDYNKVKT